MRLALFGQKGIPAHWGGVEAHVEAIATRLAARGHEVTAYVRRWWDEGGPQACPGVTLRRLPSLRTKHLDAATHSALCAADTLRRPFDVVHVHSVGPALFACLPRLGGRAVVVTIHALDYRREKWGPMARAALRLGEQAALRAAHRTVVVSRAMQAHYAALGHETTYVPNGVDLPEPAPPSPWLRELGLEGGDYWLFLGRFVESKRVVELIEGYRRLPHPKPRLVVAGGDPGGGPYVAAVARAAAGCADLVLPGLVRGRLKAELLSNAQAYVSPASLEGLPIAVLEAMAHRLPCLLNDLPEHREAAGDGGAAILTDMSTAEGIAAALGRFAALDPDRRAVMGAAGRARVRAEYVWDRVVDRLERVYVDGLQAARR